jgi:glycerol uptake facilitator-like aquaporin
MDSIVDIFLKNFLGTFILLAIAVALIAFPPTVDKGFLFPACSPAFVVICVVDSHSNCSEVKAQLF